MHENGVRSPELIESALSPYPHVRGAQQLMIVLLLNLTSYLWASAAVLSSKSGFFFFFFYHMYYYFGDQSHLDPGLGRAA